MYKKEIFTEEFELLTDVLGCMFSIKFFGSST